VGLTGTISIQVTRALIRTALVAAAAGVLLAAAASPAAAHTRAQASTDFHSSIDAAPQLPGVTWRVYAGGEFLELTNTSDRDVVVTGYEGEPYLRIGPEGVFTNRNSPASYLNSERYGDVALPPRADASAAPEWARLAGGVTHAWHDHRVHWMSSQLPMQVAAAPGSPHDISRWRVAFSHGGADHELRGTLAWVPGTPWWPWLAAGLVLTMPALLGTVRRWQRPRLVRPAAATVAAVAAFNSIHFVDELLAWPTPVMDVLFGLLHTALFIGAGLVGAAVAWHGRYGPFLSLGIASGAVLFHQGLLQLGVLGASQLPTIWPGPVLRIAVAASVGQAVWVTVVIARGLRAGRSEGPAAGPEPADHHLPAPESRTRSTV
jgi:hypothetical protein